MGAWAYQISFYMERYGKKLRGCLCVIAVIIALFYALVPPAMAATNQTITFTARLKNANGTVAADGSYNVRFKLYTQESGGAAVWSEAHYDTNGTADGEDYRAKVVNGYLSVKLGSRVAFENTVNWNDNLWLSMEIGGTTHTNVLTSVPWDGEMSPRIQLTAVPYSLNAGALGGKSAGDFIQLGQGKQTTAGSAPTIYLNTTGTGNLIQLQHNDADVFTVTNDGDITLGNTTDHNLSIAASSAGTDGKSLQISGGDGGSGTTRGGDITITGGKGSDGGADGIVKLGATAYSTAADDANCHTNGAVVGSSCTITQATVNSSSAALIGFSEEGQTATLPDPTATTPGRILYLIAATDSLPFTLALNDGIDTIQLAPKSAQTVLWNGADWVFVGGTPDTPIAKQAPAQEMTIAQSSPQTLAIENTASPDTTSSATADPNETTQTTDVTSTQDLSSTFRLPSSSSAPTTENGALAGSMYYDSSLGKVQCFESSGWGSCGDAPDTFVTISPEYKNAVMNGTDIGVMSSDFCSDTLNINDGSGTQADVCGAGETYNFYNWTTKESSDQTRSIYLTYQLPDNFKGFVADSTSVMGRTNSGDSAVSYQIYRDNGTGLSSCGSLMSVSTDKQSTWQRGSAAQANDPAICKFEPGDSILFRINLTAKKDAHAYVSNVQFTFSNN